MTDDLITRLRNHIAITTKIHYSPKDGYPEPVMVHGPSPICQEAADEIERLRAERDEARREICDRVATPRYNIYIPIATARRYAEERGWNCFKEATDDR